MIGSSVYHLLAFNGNILGISGIYGSQVSKLLNSVRSFFDTKDIKTKASRQTNRVGTTKSEPPKVAGILRDWKFAFVAGLLVGGGILRVYRSEIEGRIGIPIFDDAFLKEIHPLQTFLVGALIGAGTNVCPSLDDVNDRLEEGVHQDTCYAESLVSLSVQSSQRQHSLERQSPLSFSSIERRRASRYPQQHLTLPPFYSHKFPSSFIGISSRRLLLRDGINLSLHSSLRYISHSVFRWQGCSKPAKSKTFLSSPFRRHSTRRSRLLQ